MHLNVRQQQQQQQHPQPQPQQSRPSPSPQPRHQPTPDAMRNGHARPNIPTASYAASSGELSGYERPISNDRRVYDEIPRKVCDFLWNNVIQNALVRKAISESPGTNVEVEARWGQILQRDSNNRATGMHQTECVVSSQYGELTKFESTMTMIQHRKMNKYLNEQVAQSQPDKNSDRAQINYKHTFDTDQFFELDQEGFMRLPPATREIIGQSKQRARIRVTHDSKTGEQRGAIIKQKLANLEISSPQTEWDYRIGVNLEIEFPGPLEGLKEVVETGKSPEAMKRHKDRVSYAFLDAYQIDLTQVAQGGHKNHELELEMNADVLLESGDKILAGQSSNFESLVNGMINNLRVLSREITPAGPSA